MLCVAVDMYVRSRVILCIGMGMCVGLYVDMRLGMCVGMCMGMVVGVCMSMCVGMGVGVCMGMFVGMVVGVGACVGMITHNTNTSCSHLHLNTTACCLTRNLHVTV